MRHLNSTCQVDTCVRLVRKIESFPSRLCFLFIVPCSQMEQSFHNIINVHCVNLEILCP
jgi:hypothetical protein